MLLSIGLCKASRASRRNNLITLPVSPSRARKIKAARESFQAASDGGLITSTIRACRDGAHPSSRRRTALGTVARLVFRLRNAAGQILFRRLLIRAMYNNRISTAENKGFCNSSAIAATTICGASRVSVGLCGGDAASVDVTSKIMAPALILWEINSNASRSPCRLIR
jgi:hypothetical protein